jgi:Ti-type conjugative transfer relaxase TraA
VAVPHFRATIIGAGRSPVAAAAYRHRTEMDDESQGRTFRYANRGDLAHEEISQPVDTPLWLRNALQGQSTAKASEILWNAVVAGERQVNGQFAREIVIALPNELTMPESIALMREFVVAEFAAKGIIADWVVHDVPGNPHVHLMHTLRPVTERGFGNKKIAVLDANGAPIRVNGKIVYRNFVGYRNELVELRQAWANAANRHLALSGHETRIDLRSYAAQGIDVVPTKHLGPAGAANARKTGLSYAAHSRGPEHAKAAAQILAQPARVLAILGTERSTFGERDIAKTVHRFVDDPATFADVMAKVKASPDLVTIRPEIKDPETKTVAAAPVYSTREIVRAEHAMAQAADALAQRRGLSVEAKIVARSIAGIEGKDPKRPFKFDPEQVDAVRHVTGDSAIAAVVGFAGAGKSTLLEAANLAWTAAGHRVVGAALAGKAAEGLQQSSGIASRTLASWEHAWAAGRDQLAKGDVFVIDEAGMVSSKQMARVVSAVKVAGAKLVLVGDAMQLQPIEAGASFRAITERIGYLELGGIRRQKDAWAQDASRQLARGQVRAALDAYRAHDAIRQPAGRVDAAREIVTDWMSARIEVAAKAGAAGKSVRGDELLVLAHTNADVFALNQGIRQALTEQGALTDARTVQTERGTREFAVGDRMIFLKNAIFDEPLAPRLGRQSVKNGMLGTVIATTGFAGEALMRVRLDNGTEVAFGADTYRNVDHGYAATIHKSQGATVDRVFVMATKTLDQHLAYVALSRHRDQVTVYAPKSDFASFEKLAETLGRSGAKTTTLDFENEAHYARAVDAFAERRGIETLASIGSMLAATIERQRARIEEGRAKLTELWQRAERAIGKNLDREPARTVEPVIAPGGRASLADMRPIGVAKSRTTKTLSADIAIPAIPIERSTSESAREALMREPEWLHRTDQLRPKLAAVFRDPEAAIVTISLKITQPGADPRLIAQTVAATPEAIGAVRGSARLVDGLAARRERAAALEAARAIVPAIRAHGLAYQRDLPKAIEREEKRRPAMAVAIPALTERAHTMLVEAEAARHAAGDDAYSAATRIILADKQASAELKTINEALIARFGTRTFTQNANNRDRVAIVSLVAPEERSRLETITPTFEAIRRFGREQAVAERRVEVKTMNETGSLLPAITTHAKTVADAALETALAAPAYRNELDKVAALAPVIWRDPAAAIKAVETTIQKPEQRDRLADVIKSEPEQFGASRGTDRLIDRFTTAGTEWKATLAAAETASVHVRFAVPALSHEIEAATVNEEARRARMRVEVPGLSQTAATAVDGLAKIKEAVAFDAAVKALPDGTKAELRAFETALSKRLGPNVSAGDRAALASVPEPQRKTFEAARETIKTVTRAMDTDRQQRVVQERLAQGQKKDKGIAR